MRDEDVRAVAGIPVLAPILTLVDISVTSGPETIDRLVNAADRLDLVDPESLRAELSAHRGRRGVARLREALDRHAFQLTDSHLERRFLRLVASAGLTPPLTQRTVDGFRVDFFWPDLGLVVETDGLRYHRTPAEQARDRKRDQAHVAAGRAALRFTHAQVRFEAPRVVQTLETVARRFQAARTPE